MVTRDAFVQILDFGLAKLVPLGSQGSRGRDEVTITRATEAGMVLGTVGYMSPEQASGLPVDFRSDQYSFGSILYEMITGRRAFDRPTSAQTLSAIIESEPEPLAVAAPKTPTNLVWIVERCLAKDPEDRYGSSKDLARDLAALRDQSSGISAVGVAPPAARRLRLSPRALIAARSPLRSSGRRSSWDARAFSMNPRPSSNSRSGRGRVLRARYTPDGGSIIYGASWEGTPREIFTSRLDGTRVAALRRQERRRPRRLVKRRVGGSAQENVERKRHPRHHASCGRGRAGTPRKRRRGGLESRRDAACRGDNARTTRRGSSTRSEGVCTRRRAVSTIRCACRAAASRSLSSSPRRPRSPLRPSNSTSESWTRGGRRRRWFVTGPPDSFSGVYGGAGIGRCCLLPGTPSRGTPPNSTSSILDGQVTTLYRGIGSFLPQDLVGGRATAGRAVEGRRYLMFGSSEELSEKNLGWLNSSWLDDISEDGGTVPFPRRKPMFTFVAQMAPRLFGFFHKFTIRNPPSRRTASGF